jgi:CubicO group peptidase (beta-lactamase class C family)
VRLNDPVSKYIIGFKEGITLEHLLLHISGLPAGSATSHFESGREEMLKHLVTLSLKAEPGKKFVYSDLGFILLGVIVEKVVGESLDRFCSKQIFEPLAMSDTTFCPAGTLRPRIAPTEKGLRGQVHDPRSVSMGGVAGHAGLFGTADDLIKFTEALLADKLLKPAGTKLFTTRATFPADSGHWVGTPKRATHRIAEHYSPDSAIPVSPELASGSTHPARQPLSS